MIRRPPRYTRTDTLFPYTALFRSRRRAGDDVQNRAASFMAGGDVEEAKLVRALRVIDARLFDRIARVLQGNEVHALYDPAAGHVEAGDDADGDGHPGWPPALRSEERRVGKEGGRPCRSGWSPLH